MTLGFLSDTTDADQPVLKMARRELMTINDGFSIFLKPLGSFSFIIVVHIFLVLILVFPSPRLQRGGCRRLYWRFVPIRRIRGKASHSKSDWPNVTQPSIRKFRKKFVSSPTKRHPINGSPPPHPNHNHHPSSPRHIFLGIQITKPPIRFSMYY